jgi:hypothetical protein
LMGAPKLSKNFSRLTLRAATGAIGAIITGQQVKRIVKYK